ncbi:MAG: hypothetical protein ACXAD7_16280 [Candidatus Kariarchaeaceae archaeon]
MSLHTSLFQNPFEVVDQNFTPRREEEIVEKVCSLLGIRYDSCDAEVVITSPLNQIDTHDRKDEIREKLRLSIGIKLIEVFNKFSLES